MVPVRFPCTYPLRGFVQAFDQLAYPDPDRNVVPVTRREGKENPGVLITFHVDGLASIIFTNPCTNVQAFFESSNRSTSVDLENDDLKNDRAGTPGPELRSG